MKTKGEKTMALAIQIKKCRVPRGSMGLAWLGQAGFLIKSPAGVVVALDPYLSDSCAAIGRSIGVNMKRQVPAPLVPRDLLACEAMFFTHSHQDHVDPETIQPYLATGGGAHFVAPAQAAERLRSLGVPAENISLTWPSQSQKVGDLTFTATFAIPFGADDLTHVGYLVEAKNGPKIYFTGDTDYNEILSLSVAPAQPDIMVTVINPAFRNLSPADAARLAKAINPRWVIPCHHDLFPDNCLPDRLLRTNLAVLGMEKTFCPLEHGEIRIFERSKTVKKPRKKSGNR
ncbi:MBL fold metallo-hydrolase [soil metagenome]